MRKKLTTKTIDALPPAKGKRYEVRDTVLPGLHIRVSAKGGKVWNLATRVEGRMRRIKLGAYPVISLSDARQHAQGILRDIALGKYTESVPGSPEAPTLGDIIPQFIDRHAKRHTKDWKGTQSVLLRMKKLHSKPIDQIKRADVVRELEAMIADIEETGGKGTRANRGLAAIKKLYSWCIDQGIVEISPVAALKPLIKEVARDRWLSDDEIKSFWRGCEAEGYVDADSGRDSDFEPEPTRVIKSSEGGEHWFWHLSRPLRSDELQAVNKALTRKIGGDKGGHSPAKLFRLPGFPNLKYDPPFRVSLLEDTGEVHDTDELLAFVRQVGEHSRSNVVEIGDALAASHGLRSSRIIERYKHKLHSNTRGRLRQRLICGPMRAVFGDGRVSYYPGDDRSEIVWGIALDLRQAGAKPAEVLAVVTNTTFWKARERDGKAEDPERFIERVFDTELVEDDESEIEPAVDFKSALQAIDPAAWEGLPKPVRKWIIKNWIPLQKVTLLYGDGGTGKTLLALMLAVAVATGHDFLGLKVTRGRVYALLGENDETDTHIALADICRHYGVSLGDLKGRVRVASRSGFDNVLMHFEKGTRKHTDLFKQLLADVTAFDADLVILETAADLFGGNENARGEVRQFVANCCELIAKKANAAVVLCAHPSVAGLRSGDGTAGSTAWNNSARSRLYLRRELEKDGNEADPDFRVLSRVKANFAPRQDAIELVWRNGVFVVNDPVNDRPAVADIDRKLIDEVARAFDAGTPWSAHHQAGHRHVVPWIATNLKQSRNAAKAMLARLLVEGSIIEAVTDAHHHRKGLCTPEQAAKQLRNKEAK